MTAERNHSGDRSSSSEANADSTCGTLPDDPIIVARYWVVDANGKKREMARTRSGREIPFMTEDEAEAFFNKHPSDSDL